MIAPGRRTLCSFEISVFSEDVGRVDMVYARRGLYLEEVSDLLGTEG